MSPSVSIYLSGAALMLTSLSWVLLAVLPCWFAYEWFELRNSRQVQKLWFDDMVISGLLPPVVVQFLILIFSASLSLGVVLVRHYAAWALACSGICFCIGLRNDRLSHSGTRGWRIAGCVFIIFAVLIWVLTSRDKLEWHA